MTINKHIKLSKNQAKLNWTHKFKSVIITLTVAFIITYTKP